MELNFSIIIPTYNRAHVIERAIKSVFHQEGKHDFEVIIADDGSTDNTADMVGRMGHKRIRYFKQENLGPSAARNLALSKAIKDWIVYLDSDNELYADYFNVLTERLAKNDSVLYVMARAIKINELYKDGKLLKRQEDKENSLKDATLEDLITFKKAYFDVNGFAHLRKIIDEDLRWDEDIKRLEDWEFLMQIAEKYPNDFLYVAEPIVHYHRTFGTDGVISNSSYADWADAYEYIYQKHKNDKLLQGQTWYSQRVESYRHDQKDFEAGKIPPQHERWLVCLAHRIYLYKN